MSAHPFWTYSRELLAFAGAEPEPEPLPTPDPAEIARQRDRLLSSLARSGKATLLLLGLGSGALARALAESFDETGTTLVVVEPSPARARQAEAAGNLAWWSPDARHQLLTDTSPTALFLLLNEVFCFPDQCFELCTPANNPEAETDRQTLALLRQLLAKSLHAFTPAVGEASLGLAAILRPDEPRLAEFLAQLPGWLTEGVLLWDGERVPDHAPEWSPSGVPLRNLARPLAGNFAAQRTALISACAQDGWLLMLDGDERLAPATWEQLRGLASSGLAPGYLLPRLTLYPDADHVLAGYGLWPDLQLRLFRNVPGLAFTRPVHERLIHLPGAPALSPATPILHENRLHRDTSTTAEKLEQFSLASGGAVRHVLSKDYPTLPGAFFTERTIVEADTLPLYLLPDGVA